MPDEVVYRGDGFVITRSPGGWYWRVYNGALFQHGPYSSLDEAMPDEVQDA